MVEHGERQGQNGHDDASTVSLKVVAGTFASQREVKPMIDTSVDRLATIN